MIGTRAVVVEVSSVQHKLNLLVFDEGILNPAVIRVKSLTSRLATVGRQSVRLIHNNRSNAQLRISLGMIGYVK